jgi:hypothetical protein
MQADQPSTPRQTDEAQSFYQPNQSTQVSEQYPQETELPEAVTWEASEFVHHDKGAMWVVALTVVILVLVVVAVLFQAWTFAALIIVMGICFGVFGFRQPRTVAYTLDDKGIRIGEQYFGMSEFKAFGVIPEGAFYSVVLIPVKRFLPATTIYFAEEDGEDILDILGAHLPMQEMHPNVVDTLVRRLRF